MESAKARILVVDDEDLVRQFVASVLQERGYEAVKYDPAAPDPALLRRDYDVAVLDIHMPGRDGFAFLQEIARHSMATQFILITGQPDWQLLHRAVDLGAYSFLTKPFTPDHLAYAVLGALRMRQLSRRNLENDVAAGARGLGLLGDSPAIAAVRRRIAELAPLDVPVLVTGESGTGKEVAATCLHRAGPRRERPFIPVNCAGLPPALVESELFGHAQGAFTGAVRATAGYFEAAAGGTVFLDEIGDLPREMQSRLLRVLDQGEYNRVGEPVPRRADVRVISATNRDLERMVREQAFRADLYYRLHGSEIRLPPLRERPEDVPPLVRHFLGEEGPAVAPEAMDRLRRHPWPGNVRELSMAVRTLKGTAPNRIITAEMVGRFLGHGGDGAPPAPRLTYRDFKARVLAASEKAYFESLLQEAGGNVTRAAAWAGLDRKNLYVKLDQLGIGH